MRTDMYCADCLRGDRTCARACTSSLLMLHAQVVSKLSKLAFMSFIRLLAVTPTLTRGHPR